MLFKLFRVLDIDKLYRKQAIWFIYINNLFNIKTQTHNLRKKKYFEIPFVTTKIASLSYAQVGLRSPDDIPEGFLNRSTHSHFKYK